jgi:transcriptional regulator with XRE-family HTH domain
MPRPAYKTLGDAIASVMDARGITTVALAQQMREREWKVDQSRVSKWRNGHARPHDIDIFPDIEAICRVPRGTIFRLAGYVDDGTDGTRFKINKDDPAEVALWELEGIPEFERRQFVLQRRARMTEPPPPSRRQPRPAKSRRRRAS